MHPRSSRSLPTLPRFDSIICPTFSISLAISRYPRSRSDCSFRRYILVSLPIYFYYIAMQGIDIPLFFWKIFNILFASLENYAGTASTSSGETRPTGQFPCGCGRARGPGFRAALRPGISVYVFIHLSGAQGNEAPYQPGKGRGKPDKDGRVCDIEGGMSNLQSAGSLSREPGHPLQFGCGEIQRHEYRQLNQ